MLRNIPRIYGFMCLGIIVSATSCGGSTEQKSSGSERKSTSAVVESHIDIHAKSDSKGIGKFTVAATQPFDKESAGKGELIYTSKCAGCHTLTETKLIGPGLKGVTEIRTPEWILNMIVNPEEMTQKDPVARALMKEYLVQMTYQGVTDAEAKQLLDYLKQNDEK